ncbi:GNAT family N-acetyltransferase [Mycobacterium sp. SMC-4]|uniref:GNAT family N-acetyltransferase n=1 Tax=Mycobacterium sp. SMC-4 TaxID=2857059 RepID=UPI0021B4D4FF|nr:GNAT family N-acetyltransferase [Mycobacterium sp. SMC-4]
MAVLIGPADPRRVTELAELAARTFPLACPPSSRPEDVSAFIAENLSAARFCDYLHDPDRTVLTASRDGCMLGYAMLIRAAPDDPDVAAAVTDRPAVELSKMYVASAAHGTGTATSLMTATLRHAEQSGAACLWLGVNQRNTRAQRFYSKHGFTVAGTKSFRLGAALEQDYVMLRPV